MFLKARAPGAAARGGASLSYIGAETSVTGDIASESEIHLDGKVTGDVRCAALTLGATGEVRGNVKAGEARLAGLIDGAVDAGALMLEATARITGDVVYESLSVAAGAEVEGRFRRRRGEGEGPAARPIEAAKPRRRSEAPAPLFGDDAPTAEAAE